MRKGGEGEGEEGEADGQTRVACSGLVSDMGGCQEVRALVLAACLHCFVHLHVRPRAPEQAAPASPLGAGADPHRGRPAVPNVERAVVSEC